MEEAIKSFSILDGDKTIILGDMYELGDDSLNEHKKIIKLCEENKHSKCIFIERNFIVFQMINTPQHFLKQIQFFNSGIEIREKYSYQRITWNENGRNLKTYTIMKKI